jgi:hypothetical protein
VQAGKAPYLVICSANTVGVRLPWAMQVANTATFGGLLVVFEYLTKINRCTFCKVRIVEPKKQSRVWK